MEDDEPSRGGSDQISQGPGEPDRNPPRVEDEGPTAHTSPEQGHPAGEGERSDREVGGPTSPEDPPEEDVEGGAHGSSPGSHFESHDDQEER